MKRILFSLAVIGLALTLTLPASPHAQLRLATWNLHNFFDEQDDPSTQDTVFSHSQVEHKIDQLAQVIGSLRADVIGVEEVENLPLLERLAQRVGGFQQVILVQGNDRFRGINVGLLSRVPVLGYRTHRRQVLPQVEGNHPGMHFSRDCLEVHLGGALPFVVLVNHFKSKAFGRQQDSDARRRAQAEGVVEVVRELGPMVAVIGDLNDGPGSWPLEPLHQCGLLTDPFGPLSMEQRFTLKFHGQLACIDHILLAQGLSRYLVAGSARVHRGRDVETASDHCAISVDLAY